MPSACEDRRPPQRQIQPPLTARDRYVTLDPPTAHQEFGTYQEDGEE
jgi:hypothetical protein